MNPGGAIIVGTLFLITGLGVYFIPAIVAFNRKHPNKVAIIVLNFFLGWTVIGWVGSLVWACTHFQQPVVDVTKSAALSSENKATIKKCPFCAEDVLVEAVKCRYCGSDISSV